MEYLDTKKMTEAGSALRPNSREAIQTVASLQPLLRSSADETERLGSVRKDHAVPALLNAHTLPVLATGVEFAVVAIASFGAGAFYHQLAIGQLPFATFYLMATLLLTALFVIPCALGRDYSLKRLLLPKEQLQSVFLHWNYAYSLFVFALFMTHATDFYSRGSIIAQYAAGLMAAAIIRMAMTRFVAQGLEKGRLGGKRVAIVGEAQMAADIEWRLRFEGQGVDLVHVVKLASASDRSAVRDPIEISKETRAALDDVAEFARQTTIDDVVICLPWSENERIRAFVEGLAVVPATLHLAPEPAAAWARNPVVARVGWTPTIRLSRAPLTLKDRILKRAFDLFTASLLLVLLAPLFLIIAVLIKLDSQGPVFFRQRRNGFNQQEFRIFKFRTMTTLDDGAVVRQATRNDKRVTRVGRILRRTNFDELPQLFNVLAGHMSLVGPRPHAVAHNNEYEEKIRLYARRHNVKPGITGWSQVNGYRGETDSIDKMRRRVEHDLYYIDNWSLLFDIRIMFMTIFSPRSYRNAY